MKRPALAMLAAMPAAALGGAAAAKPPPGYALVWSDEFDRDGAPDSAKWVADTHANKTGWYNKEAQYYSAGRLENARVRDGRLVITARREALTAAPDHGGQRYTSARLITKDRASWTYGFFEVRAKLPCGAGSWPAIWTLGSTRGHPDGGRSISWSMSATTRAWSTRPSTPAPASARTGTAAA